MVGRLLALSLAQSPWLTGWHTDDPSSDTATAAAFAMLSLAANARSAAGRLASATASVSARPFSAAAATAYSAGGSGRPRKSDVRWGRVVGGAFLAYGVFRLLDGKFNGDAEHPKRRAHEQRSDPSNRPAGARHSEHREAPEGRYHGVDAAADAALSTPAPAKPVRQSHAADKSAPPTTAVAAASTVAVRLPDVVQQQTAPVVAALQPEPVAAKVASAASTVPDMKEVATPAVQEPVLSSAAAPLPAEPHVHHSTAQAAEDDVDEDALDEAEAARLRAEALAPRSAPAHEHPGRPYVRSLVAAEIPARVERRDADVLLHVYEHWCGSCRMMSPVVDGVAAVLHQTVQQQSSAAGAPVRPLQVLSMDSEANFLPGFLREEETLALPLLKFFPQCGSRRYPESVRQHPACQPSVYEKRGSVEAMVNWLHARVSEQNDALAAAGVSAASFDLNTAHAVAREMEPATVERLKKAQQARWDAESADHPAMKLHELAPCGPLMSRAVHAHMLLGHRSYVDQSASQDEISQLFQAYRECAQKEKKNISRFWAEVKHVADGEVEVEKAREEAEKAEEEAKAQ